MNKYQENMYRFINSAKFKFRNILKEGREYKDKKTGFVIGRVIGTLKEFNPDKDKEPVIYLSGSQKVLQVLGEQFNKDNWNSTRFKELTGEEFDFIVLRQKTKFKEFNERQENN